MPAWFVACRSLRFGIAQPPGEPTIERRSTPEAKPATAAAVLAQFPITREIAKPRLRETEVFRGLVRVEPGVVICRLAHETPASATRSRRPAVRAPGRRRSASASPRRAASAGALPECTGCAPK